MRNAAVFREALGVRTRPRVALSMSLATQLRSNISSETGQSDVFKRDVSRSREGVRNCAGDIFRGDHFAARPIAFDIVPDVGVGRRWINVNHTNFAVA